MTVGWWDLLSYALGLDGILILILVAAGVAALRRLGLRPVTTQGEVREHRAIGVTAWFVVLSGSYTLAASYSVADAVAVAAAAVGAWLLMPDDQAHKAPYVLSQPPELRAKAISQTLRAGAARRVLPQLSKAMRDKVADGSLPFESAQGKLDRLESRTIEPYQEFGANDCVIRISAQERGFGMLTSRSPWRRAKWGVVTGTVISGLHGSS